MIYKKSVVLKSVTGGKEKAVVNMECDSGEIVGNVRLYNFDKEPSGILSLGILSDGSVVKAGLNRGGTDFYTFKLNGNSSLNCFSCALVNLVGGEATALAMGSTNQTATTEERLASALSVFDTDPKVETVQQILDENEIYLEDQDEIDRQIENEICLTENNCANCKYRDAFFKLEDDFAEPKAEESDFYSQVKDQIGQLFEKYPEEEILKQIIPESKWAKIDYEDKGEYYVVGLLYENGQIKYVCYGVPGINKDNPPEELSGVSQWLPIDSEKPNGFGYWITYQDAQTGENVAMKFEIV